MHQEKQGIHTEVMDNILDHPYCPDSGQVKEKIDIGLDTLYDPDPIHMPQISENLCAYVSLMEGNAFDFQNLNLKRDLSLNGWILILWRR